ncbi:MAG: SUMF1/EgtB/PvdO family nonheme iron enzyme, partial [Fibrobacterota bacterium]
MTRVPAFLFLLVALALGGSHPPRVYKVEARQRSKTDLVDIYYSLTDPDNRVVFVNLYLSDDNGKSWGAPIRTVAGDTGFVTVGEKKHIVWNAGRDFPNQYNLGFRVKIDANDKKCPSRGDEGMAFIPEGEYRVADTKVHSMDFCIDKWEFPNVRDNLPQTGVSFAQAVDSCKSLGKQLCSETQWEIACAGPLTKPYPYGNEYKKDKCNTEGDSINPIGVNRFCVSLYGVFDLSGNAYEWVADWY